MSGSTDFSQFRRAPQDAATQNQDPSGEFAQFKRAPKRGAYETFVERPGQIVGQSAVAGFKALPRSAYDLLKTVVSKTGGDLSKLEEAEKNAPDWLKDFANNHLRTYEDIREDQKKTGKQYGSDKPLAQPEGATERALEKFGRFVGEAPAFGGVGGARGLASLGGLAAGIQVGEEGNLGPVGQLITGTLGALTPGGVANAGKAIFSPRKAAAKAVARSVPAKSLDIQKQLIKDARDAGIQLDVGSLSNNGMVKWVQNQLAQSPLVGDSLDNFKKQLSKQVISEYEGVANSIGQSRFQTHYQAGEAVQNAIRSHKENTLSEARNLYNDARKRGGNFQVFTGKVGDVVKELEESLAPGALKSPEQKAVLDAVQKLRGDVLTAEGGIKSASINDLINDKIALNDIIDYEVQGGAKQLLKKVVKALDDTIAAHGSQDPTFAREWKTANKKFADHAKTFRNQNISNVLKTQDPATILNKMNSSAGIRDVKKALSGSKAGKDLFADLSRYKIDDLLEKALEQNVKDQIQFGKVGNALKKGNTQEILKELMEPEQFKRLERLTRLSGNVAESASKFLNTSQSGTTVVNMAAVAKILSDIGQAFYGNFAPAAYSIGGLAGARGLAKAITNPKFLMAVEDAILASKSGNKSLMERAGARLLKEAGRSTARGARGADEDEFASERRQSGDQLPLGAS